VQSIVLESTRIFQCVPDMSHLHLFMYSKDKCVTWVKIPLLHAQTSPSYCPMIQTSGSFWPIHKQLSSSVSVHCSYEWNVCRRLHSFSKANKYCPPPPGQKTLWLSSYLLPKNSLSAVTSTSSQQSDLVETMWQKAYVFVTCKQTFQGGLETVQSVVHFQWQSYYRTA